MPDDGLVSPLDDGMTDVLFRGGPQGLPGTMRTLLEPMVDCIKIPHRGGYEHFTRDVETAGSDQVTFSWLMRTQIAE